MTFTTRHPGCLVARSRSRPTPATARGWAAQKLGTDGRHGYQTWLLYDPGTHRVARVLGPRPFRLHRALLDAGARVVLNRPDQTVYLVPCCR